MSDLRTYKDARLLTYGLAITATFVWFDWRLVLVMLLWSWAILCDVALKRKKNP